jgi:serine/threonine protein kinase
MAAVGEPPLPVPAPDGTLGEWRRWRHFYANVDIEKTVWETFRDFMGSGRGRGANNVGATNRIAHTSIGKGSHGIVWKATDPHAAEGDVASVAIKIIHFTTSEQKQAILSEIAVLQDCTDEGIFPNFYAAKLIEEPTAMFSPFQKPSKAIIIMELLEGEELLQYLEQEENKDLTLDQIQNIIKNIVFTVKQLHKKGYVHHDIKPKNVYISDKIRLVDAGSTRRTGTSYTGSPSIPQTHEYSLNLNSREDNKGTRYQELAARLFEPYVGGRGTVDPLFDKYSIYKIYCTMMEQYRLQRESQQFTPILEWEPFLSAFYPKRGGGKTRRRRRRHSRRQH